MNWLFIILAAGLLAVVVESYLDRNGENIGSKKKDAIWLTITALSVSSIACWIGGVSPIKTLPLILSVRVLVFDYLSAYFLIKNGVIVGHWFTYSGKTAKWDKLISRVHPMVRLGVRIFLFALAVWFFLS